jgi:hypothetical protein
VVGSGSMYLNRRTCSCNIAFAEFFVRGSHPPHSSYDLKF